MLNPANPYVLRPQLLAAAQELPLRAARRPLLRADHTGPHRGDGQAGTLRRRPNGWYATGGDEARRIDLRAAGRRLDIVEEATGRVIGVVDSATADLCAHEGAVYVHRGDTYLCQPVRGRRGGGDRSARLDPGYLTSPRRETEVRVLAERASRGIGAAGSPSARSRCAVGSPAISAATR